MEVFIIAALTADGWIGRHDADLSTRWTSKEDAAWFAEKSKAAGVVVMGSNTFHTLPRPLSGRVNIVFSREIGKNQLELKRGIKLQPGEAYFTKQSPTEVIDILAVAGFTQVAISGGATIYTLFLQAGLVDKLYLTIEPVVFGQGISLFNNDVTADLKLINLKQLSSQTIMLEYQALRE